MRGGNLVTEPLKSRPPSAEEPPVAVPRPVLAVVPAYVRSEDDMQLLLTCLVTLQATAPGTPVAVVDDASPASHLVDQLAAIAGEVGATVHRAAENRGFASTVNVGLRQALAIGADAVLVNADIEFDTPGWLEVLREREDTQRRPAAVVGALLRYPDGRIQHAGTFYSPLTRHWGHRFHFGPGTLPDAHLPAQCPVTAALMLIRHETLATVGLYDEGYFMGWEDIDYCLRTFAAGLECVYEPRASAIHAESVFRKNPSPELWAKTQASWERLVDQHTHAEMARWIPAIG